MKKFIGEIHVDNPELFNPVADGLERAGYEVEMYEKNKFDHDRNRPCADEKIAAFKVFKFVCPISE